MTIATLILLLLSALGGVGVFLLGMEMMTRSLEQIAGHHLRLLLQRMSSTSTRGLIGGTVIAAGIHSGPTTVMIVGFINAGLLSLVQSIPLILGANIGTTLSMQLVAFDLGQYALPGIAVGAGMRLIGQRDSIRQAGSGIIGLGLLFLGLDLVKAPLPTLREAEFVRALASSISAATMLGLLMGIVLSTLLTSFLMSSGATIAVAFALAQEGILTGFEELFPLILGSHIGTCVLTLIGSAGTSINARRSAIAHLLFNVLGTIIACLMIKFYFWIIPLTSTSLVRQTANAHTGIQLINALIFLPFTPMYARLVERLMPGHGEQEAEPSYLDRSLLRTPEAAIQAVIYELRRQARVCEAMLRQTLDGLMLMDKSQIERIFPAERAVDSIREAIHGYVVELGSRDITENQSVIVQHLARCSNDLERVGDNIETIAQNSRQKLDRGLWFDAASIEDLQEIGNDAARLLQLAGEALDPLTPPKSPAALEMADLRKKIKSRIGDARTRFNDRVATGAEEPINGIFFMRFLDSLTSINRHLKSVLRLESRTIPFRTPARIRLPVD